MKVYQSFFIEIIMEKDNKSDPFFIIEWKKRSATMPVTIFKDEMLRYANCLKQYRPKKIIQNLQEFFFTIAPEIQVWVDENVNRIAWEMGINQGAIVVSGDVFAQISVEQSMDEKYGKTLQFKYFANLNEAVNWILDL